MSSPKPPLVLVACLGLVMASPGALGDHAPCRHGESAGGQVFPLHECELQVVRQRLEVVFDEHPEQVKLEGEGHWSDYAHCFGIGGRRMFSSPRATVTATYEMANPTQSRIEREMAFPFVGELCAVVEGRPNAHRKDAGDAWMALGHEVTCDGERVAAQVVALAPSARGEAQGPAAEPKAPRITDAVASQWGCDGQFLDPDTGRLYPRGSLLPGWQRYRPNWVKAPLAWAGDDSPVPARAAHGLGFLRYRLAFDAGQRRSVVVRYRTLTDYDTVIDELCCRPMIAQFCYLLRPVRYWSSFGPIEVRLTAPRGFRVVADLGDWSCREHEDLVTYSTTLKRPEGNLHVALYRGISPLADFLLYSLRGGCPPTREQEARREGLATVERIYWQLARDESLRLSVREAALKQLKKTYAASKSEGDRREKVAELLWQMLLDRLAVAQAAGGAAARARVLTEAILDADRREAVAALAALVAPQEKAHLRSAFQEIALGWSLPVFYQTGPFRSLRNSINAYGLIDREGAVAFYRSLLRSDKQPQRDVGVYGVGELRVAEAIGELLAAVVAERENSLKPSSVCVALGKIGTPAAHDALVRMLLQEPTVVRRSWSVLAVMTEVCGRAGGSPRGSWTNGCWATAAEDREAIAERFARAMTELAERTSDARLAREARGRASAILRHTAKAPGRQ